MDDKEEYLTDDGENLDEGYFQNNVEEDDEESSEESSLFEEDLSSSPEASAADYKGKMTQEEIKLSTAYDDIVAARKKDTANAIEDATITLVSMNPKHTNAKTINDIVKEIFMKQGHNRMQNSVYTSEPLRSEDVDEDYLGGGDGGFNNKLTEELEELIARFIDYLAKRDLSKDSTNQRKRKNRHIPAFIIFLFSSGAYNFILHCPTMPKVYQKQIDYAFKQIMKSKYDIVELLARRYEEKGRPLVAERVRKMQLSWFDREPAEIRTLGEFSDLDLTYDDIVIYREYRSKFTNTSRAITQDVISDLIEVSDDEGKGSYYKLKDKTRSEAIADVKQVWKDWCKDNAADQEIAQKLIWKD